MARGAHFKVNIVDDDLEHGSEGGVLPGILFTVILAIALTFFLRNFAIDSYEIPSGSMEQTIQIGNRVIGEKISYRFRDPVPGEIVTFVREQDGEKVILIKRVIAVGGQTIDLVDGAVYVDGVKLDEPYEDVNSRAVLIFWPPEDVATI